MEATKKTTKISPNRPVGGGASKAKLLTCSSMDINMDQYPELMDYLPKDYQYHVCRYEEVSQPSPMDHLSFEATLRMTINTKEDLQVWLKSMPVTWRVAIVRPSKGKKTILKTDYRCQHHTRTQPSRRVSKNTNCSAKLKVTIVRVPNETYRLCRSTDAHIPAYPTIVELSHVHNHNLHDAAALRFRDVGAAAVEKLIRLFEAGHSPASALDFLKYDLQVEYGDDYVHKSADRSICPDLKFCNSLYARIYKAEYSSTEGQAPLQTSSEKHDHSPEITAVVVGASEGSDNAPTSAEQPVSSSTMAATEGVVADEEESAEQPVSSSTMAATEGVVGDEESDVDDVEFRSKMWNFTETLLLNKGELKGGMKALMENIDKMVGHRSLLLEPPVLLSVMHTMCHSGAHALRVANVARPRFRLAERLRIKGGRKPRNSVKRKAKSSTPSTHKKTKLAPVTEPPVHAVQNVVLVTQGGEQSQAQVQTIRVRLGSPSEQMQVIAVSKETMERLRAQHGTQPLQIVQRPLQQMTTNQPVVQEVAISQEPAPLQEQAATDQHVVQAVHIHSQSPQPDSISHINEQISNHHHVQDQTLDEDPSSGGEWQPPQVTNDDLTCHFTAEPAEQVTVQFQVQDCSQQQFEN